MKFKLIDEQGRIFGKVNIIDFGVVVIVIVVIGSIIFSSRTYEKQIEREKTEKMVQDRVNAMVMNIEQVENAIRERMDKAVVSAAELDKEKISILEGKISYLEDENKRLNIGVEEEIKKQVWLKEIEYMRKEALAWSEGYKQGFNDAKKR